MEELVIEGGTPLQGTVRASGAKNAALPIIAAVLLTEGETVLRRVPGLTDVSTILSIVRALGVEAAWVGPNCLRLLPSDTGGTVAPPDPVRRMRGSVCVLGPLLATRGAVTVPMPGGCVIGERPIDLHVKGLRALGAEVEADDVQVRARTDGLRGARVDMAGPNGSTVLGTANVMMAATLAEGTTVIEHAAREPEVQDLAAYLTACGARIRGVGTSTVTVHGVDRLRGVEHELIPDRIETGTFLAAGAVTGGEVWVEDCRADHLAATLDAFRQMGIRVESSGKSLCARAPQGIGPVDLETAPYPGFATDMHPQVSTLLSLADGVSTVTEKVYPERFTHLTLLNRLGARFLRSGNRAVINGVAELHGDSVEALDLRAGAALVLAGLAADGVTRIAGVDQIDRGYQDLEGALRSLGARIHRREAETRERRTA